MNSYSVKPPYTYVGGKRRMLDFIVENIPVEFGNYHEPFLGGGAVALAIMETHPNATYHLSDLNPELMTVWAVIGENPEPLIDALTEHVDRNTREYFMSIRNWDRRGVLQLHTPVERAARFIYLCNSSFGGGYRLDKNGMCGNAYGMSHKVKEDNIRNLHQLFSQRDIRFSTQSFVDILPEVAGGDFVYFDPPYATDSDDGGTGVDAYVKNSGIGQDFQKNIKTFINRLTARGASVLASNADTETTRELYEGWNRISKKVMFSGGIGRRISEDVLWGNHHLIRSLETS